MTQKAVARAPRATLSIATGEHSSSGDATVRAPVTNLVFAGSRQVSQDGSREVLISVGS